MPERPPVVVMDETGHSGEDLLEPERPVFAVAPVHISEADAQRVVDAGIGRTQADELKFSGLRRNGAGRDTILEVLSDAALPHETAFVAAAHKPWMLTAKLIDELVEPRMTARGLSIPWYASGAPAQMADDLCRLGPTELGELYDELGVLSARARLHVGGRNTTPRSFASVPRGCRRPRAAEPDSRDDARHRRWARGGVQRARGHARPSNPAGVVPGLLLDRPPR